MPKTVQSKKDEAPYRILKIAKKGRPGEFRMIYAPRTDQMLILRSMAGKLTTKAQHACPENVHGFMRHRSPVTNAQAHIGHDYSLCFDLENFFESVVPERVKGKLSQEEMALVFVDGAARQGLPTSPAVANLAFAGADKAILKWIAKAGKNIVYTRYADDLSFSFDDPALIPAIKKSVEEIINRSGFKLNARKTSLQTAQNGRRIICGVGVDDTGIYPTRDSKRRLRAAEHHLEMMGEPATSAASRRKTRQEQRVQGMREWVRVKAPDPQKELKRRATDDYEALRIAWKLRKIDWTRVKKNLVEDVDLTDGVIVTADAALIMGMSTFTTGWVSCMRQPGGQYRRGVVFWAAAPSSFLAYVPSGHAMTIAGVERPRMKTRCLVHILANGAKIYDRLYGNPEDIPVLKRALETAGYEPAAQHRGQRVLGRILFPTLPLPYFDSLAAARHTSAEGLKYFTLAVR